MTKLTDLSIQKLPIPERGQRTYWNKGFGVRVSQGGSKSFVAKHEGRLHTLGKYPAMSLKMARQRFLELKAAQYLPKSQTRLETARSAYLKECEAKNRPNTVRMYRQYLNELPDQALADIKRIDIDTTDAHRVTAWKVFFNWCLRNELADRNPFAHQSVTYNSRDRVLTSDELKALWQYEYRPYSDYVKLLILTGQRRGQFNQFELRQGSVYFPASVMKGKVAHELPTTPLMIPILERLQPFNGWSVAKKRMDKHTHVTGYVLHDIRRTFSTTMASLQVPLHVTEHILAHRSGTVSGVAATYNRYSYFKEMQDALDRYEQHLHTVIA